MKEPICVVTKFFDAYRRHRQVVTFFDAFRDVLASRGQLAEQNFLLASDLLRQSEVNWCCVLRWLLDPRASSRLAAEFQRRLLRKYAPKSVLPPNRAYAAEREVHSEDGIDRNDIVLTARGKTVVIEAKVNARYDKEQHQRYIKRWRGRAEAILYIVRRRKELEHNCSETTCVCEWHELADLLKELIDEQPVRDLRDEERWTLIAIDFVELIRREQ